MSKVNQVTFKGALSTASYNRFSFVLSDLVFELYYFKVVQWQRLLSSTTVNELNIYKNSGYCRLLFQHNFHGGVNV